VLLNLAILVVSGLSEVLGTLGRILLSYLVHMHSHLRSLRQGQVHVGPITWEVLPHRSQSRRRRRTRQWIMAVRWPSCQKLQRSEPNGLVTWLAHRTVRCAIRQKPSPMVNLVVGAINTPQPPHFNASKFSAFKPHTRALDFTPRHKQRDQILSQVQRSFQSNSD
jgi:hypothetical protein